MRIICDAAGHFDYDLGGPDFEMVAFHDDGALGLAEKAGRFSWDGASG
jgi:hypothetical protein